MLCPDTAVIERVPVIHNAKVFKMWRVKYRRHEQVDAREHLFAIAPTLSQAQFFCALYNLTVLEVKR